MADVSNVRITVTEEDFQSAINQFNTCKDNFTNTYLQEIAAVFTLDSSWNGDASEAFKSKFNELVNKLKTSDETMDKALADLQTAVKVYSETDTFVSGKYNAMTDTTDPFSEG